MLLGTDDTVPVLQAEWAVQGEEMQEFAWGYGLANCWAALAGFTAIEGAVDRPQRAYQVTGRSLCCFARFRAPARNTGSDSASLARLPYGRPVGAPVRTTGHK